MKRDWDLIKALLEKMEEQKGHNYFVGSMVPMGDTPQTKVDEWQHIALLIDGGLLRATDGGAVRMTWSGHDFLDAIRDDGIWLKTKEAVMESGGNASLEILKLLATGLFKEKLKKHTGLEI